ncbi:MAG TPA: hypothetical protein IGR64_06060 [Leptolyngbyaceae cyanobacterium M65_K2018_010]|nr:hypothetical protein [Leptolyngbyaceae cyanobacterium M65_K2018_010]
MSQQGGFVGGFLLGTLVGGALGGVIGALAASRLQTNPQAKRLQGDTPLAFGEFGEMSEENMEAARQGLEAKIAQLNDAIDEVRQQLGGINGYADSPWEHSSRMDS